MFNVIVDADACPVKSEVVKICKKYDIPVLMFTDFNHNIVDDYAKVFTVDKGVDSVDFKIVNAMEKGDVVVTQDYGLASLVIAKGGEPIHQNGFLYTLENIDRLLFERHINKKNRENKKRGSYIPKRKESDNEKFLDCFENLCLKKLAKINEE